MQKSISSHNNDNLNTISCRYSSLNYLVTRSNYSIMPLFNHLVLLFCYSIIQLFFASCEREEYKEYGEQKLVVEGWIDEGDVAHVVLSRSIPIYEIVDSSNFLKYAIRSATVIVSDATDCDTLRLKSASQYLPPFLYIGI